MHDPFDRRVSCGGVALVMGRLRNDGKMWKKVFNETLDAIIRKNDLFKGQPFLWVSVMYRYGIKNDLKVEFKRLTKLDKAYGVLRVALELDMEILMWADQNNLDLLHDIFMIAALEALLQVCDKYKLPKEVLIAEREKYGNIPNTIEECENYGK